jgi:putative ABC transport system permease protein
MLAVALKMLIGDPAKYLAIVLALAFTSFVMTQQPATFLGIMSRTYSFLDDIGNADLWVMNAKVRYVDDIKPLQDTQLYRVRGVPGVEWAEPLYKGSIRARLEDGNFQTCMLVGIDDASLAGGPVLMVKGTLADLRRADSVIVDADGAATKLARSAGDGTRPLDVGDVLELNDHYATVVGISRLSANFTSQPVVYTTYSRAKAFVPSERKLLSFIIVKVRSGFDRAAVARDIGARTGLGAYTTAQFREKSVRYFIRNTGILINFGLSVALGFVVGAAIAGQTFYTFTVENLRHFGVMKALGAGTGTLMRMVLAQAYLVAGVGYGLGVGGVALFNWLSAGSTLRFRLVWEIPAITGAAVFLVCTIAALISLRRVIRLEPAVVFKA